MHGQLLLIFTFNAMMTVFNILIGTSLHKILDTLPNILVGTDFNLTKLSNFECNSSDNNGIIITNNIYQNKELQEKKTAVSDAQYNYGKN